MMLGLSYKLSNYQFAES